MYIWKCNTLFSFYYESEFDVKMNIAFRYSLLFRLERGLYMLYIVQFIPSIVAVDVFNCFLYDAFQELRRGDFYVSVCDIQDCLFFQVIQIYILSQLLICKNFHYILFVCDFIFIYRVITTFYNQSVEILLGSLTNSIAYETRRLNVAFTRALQ